MKPVVIDMWSDIVCPWCYIGKRRLEAAITQTGVTVEVRHRAFQLHRSAPSDQSLPIRQFWPLVYQGWTRESSDASLIPIVAQGREVGLDLNRCSRSRESSTPRFARSRFGPSSSAGWRSRTGRLVST